MTALPPAVPVRHPSHSANELHRQALAQHHRGLFSSAAMLYRQLLAQTPDHAEAAHMLGLIEFQAGHLDAARALIECAANLAPGNAAAHSDLGVVLQALQQPALALACQDQALLIDPQHVGAHLNRGNALQQLQRHAEAIASFEQALRIHPDPAAFYNLGNCQQQVERHADAIASYGKALALRPGFPEALSNRSISLRALEQHALALASCEAALRLRPDYFDALHNQAITLQALGRHELALASCDAALALRPEFPDALQNRAIALRDLGRLQEAVDGYTRLLAAAPDYAYGVGTRFNLQLQSCDWHDYHAQVEAIGQAVEQGKPADPPFSFLAISTSPKWQLHCARRHGAHLFPPAAEPLWQGPRYRHDRIRLAYVSADFHDHPMAHLMAGLFEAHDRDRFEVIGISFGPQQRSPVRERLSAAFDRFIDVRALSDRGIASLLRDLEVDIAIDRKGYTANARTGIFAFRPAPIQVNYLAYPGSMGANYIDYILADAHVIPLDQHQHYSESVVTLPDSYQANDHRRRIADNTPARIECELPETGFVFCCFNNSYKISPDTFDVWMRLLHQVEGSVLWLLDTSAIARCNLRSEAQQRGISPERLIFARNLPQADHLARQRNADLFLDTLPYNAHTTASDALWAGLPVLTCTGDTFAGRVAGSLLKAVGLPELITASMAEYEKLALNLAKDPSQLAALRQKLSHHRDTYPLFDTLRFCRHIEAAYMMMWQRHQLGEPPCAFSVPRLP